ncbi:MAG: transglutaminase-like domain-containing protein [Flavobacteriales bacterium]
MRTPFILALTALNLHATAQRTLLPTIRSTQRVIDVSENGQRRINWWTIVPQAAPDVYISHEHGARITFHTDLDSFTVVVDSSRAQDFNIQLGDSLAWTQVAWKPSFRAVLTAATTFNDADPRPLPAFTYQAADTPELVALRKAFNLDSIAGQGNELSRMLEVMHWLHDLVPHDGQNGNPAVRNALSMVSVCKQEGRGLNCRGLSMVLNECYLALGFKARYITCLPYDSTDTECHVINMVWNNELDKWIWLDPTHDAYVMDENGTLLGPAEVRERLIDGRPLILNPDANWNHRSSTIREDYLYSYMAKNLYRLECPVESRYDTETSAVGKVVSYVQLLPLHYFEQQPAVDRWQGNPKGSALITYRTNNAAAFWAAPR